MSIRRMRRSLAPLALGISLWLILPAQSFAKALVRFVHGVPGVGTAKVTVNDGSGSQDLGSIAFGQSTAWRSIHSGSFHWALSGAGKTLADGTATVGDGAYDIVVEEKNSQVSLGIYPARAGKSGTSLVRVIHAAPELGTPQLTVDGQVVAKRLAFTQATPYLSLTPGRHTLGADRPGATTAVVSSAHMMVRSDRSYSAIVLGTRGQRVRVVTLVDRGAPLVRTTSTTVADTHPAGTTGSTVVVAPGDSLWSIARRLLGPDASNAAVEDRVVKIWDANASRIGTGDPSLIFPGTRLRV